MKSINGLSEKVLLVILDGYGINPNQTKNAVNAARTPNLDRLFRNYPGTLLDASGEAVGLPAGIVGNSEVGHMNLGSGQAVRQDLVRINEAIAKGAYGTLPGLMNFAKDVKKSGGRIHLLGLLSDGGVHSHIHHIQKTIGIFNDTGLTVCFHAFMDGRDTPKDSGKQFVQTLMDSRNFHFASMQGRSFGMDRDRRWEKIQRCYDMLVGKGESQRLDGPLEYLEREYSQNRFDEFVNPVLFHPDWAIGKNDGVFFLNFRPDRAIQLTLAFNDPEFQYFERPVVPRHYLCMTPYVPEELNLPILFDKEKISNGLSEYLSQKGVRQYKIAETEKYAHITFFFNGGEKNPFPGEEHVLVPSPADVATYDQRPEMSAYEVTTNLLMAMEDQEHQFYLVNYANADMVGHTGNYKAAVEAISVLDVCVGALVEKCQEKKMALLLTADHGNSDEMFYPDGKPHTSHTHAPVPCALFHTRLKDKNISIKSEPRALQDVAPSILKIMGITRPANFTGESIFL